MQPAAATAGRCRPLADSSGTGGRMEAHENICVLSWYGFREYGASVNGSETRQDP